MAECHRNEGAGVVYRQEPASSREYLARSGEGGTGMPGLETQTRSVPLAEMPRVSPSRSLAPRPLRAPTHARTNLAKASGRIPSRGTALCVIRRKARTEKVEVSRIKQVGKTEIAAYLCAFLSAAKLSAPPTPAALTVRPWGCGSATDHHFRCVPASSRARQREHRRTIVPAPPARTVSYCMVSEQDRIASVTT